MNYMDEIKSKIDGMISEGYSYARLMGWVYICWSTTDQVALNSDYFDIVSYAHLKWKEINE